MKKSIIAGVLCFTLMFSLSGCMRSSGLMGDFKANPVSTDADLTGDESAAIADFSVELFQNSVSTTDITLFAHCPQQICCGKCAPPISLPAGRTISKKSY